jgi:hypothetical protein
MKKFLLVLSLLMLMTMSPLPPHGASSRSEDTTPPDPEAFPMTIDFECPRDFGFHIGDEIPLTVTLAARKGVILDLVDLPQENDIHGPFEVRHRRVHRRIESRGTTYTVFYRLQCFTPAIAVDRVQFPPLQILWATQEDWDPMESRYRYRTLFSQPYEIFVSRTATYVGVMKDIKGPIPDRKAAFLWKIAVVGGGMLVIAALITWPWNFIRKRRETTQAHACPTAKDRALKALQEARENCFNYDDHRKRLYFELNAILRDFLKEVFALPGANRPAMEIVRQLKERPEYEELLDLVNRINRVIYEGSPPVDVESIVRQFNGLLERLDRAVPPGVNHDETG